MGRLSSTSLSPTSSSSPIAARPRLAVAALLTGAIAAVPAAALAQVYRCETDSGVPLYQNTPGPRCKPLDLPNLTTVPTPVPKAAPGAKPAPRDGTQATAGAGFPRVDTSAQRTRDQDRRRILADELRKEEARLGELRAEFNNGEPERRGDERNFQRYLDRVQRLREDIARSESSVASLQREIAALRD
jgi:hypothetical protein